MNTQTTDADLYIAGEWRHGRGSSVAFFDPASGLEIGQLNGASSQDLSDAVEAAAGAFKTWSNTGVLERYNALREVARLVRDRSERIAAAITREQGKPIAEARGEVANAADSIEWMAEEARRLYGRQIPARDASTLQVVIRQPVGVVAAFSPWNFPLTQAARKIAAAVATGCTIILKGPENTPTACAELVQAHHDAGVPAGVVNLVFGNPPAISEFLIPHPLVRKISFTGSTRVGKHLAMLAGMHMKRSTMELGGHAPVLIFEDADLAAAADILVASKFRNAGQVCASPSRFLVQEPVFQQFVSMFNERVDQLRVGDGSDPATQMGPLATQARVEGIGAAVDEALKHGATLERGGKTLNRDGYFYMPTVLTHVADTAQIMNDEPFGPVAIINGFQSIDDAIAEANRIPYGLTAYGYTKDLGIAKRVAHEMESGSVAVNHQGVGMPEVPFGGVKDSGQGYEGGAEALEAYTVRKFLSFR